MRDKLGTGSAFARTQGGVSARRQAVAASTGAATAGAPDSRLCALPLAQLVPTRFNPRRNFGTSEELREFGLRLKRKQLQPAVAVTREAYLALWPSEAEVIGTAIYVIANGERRWRGSREAENPTLDVLVDDEIAKSRADFLDAVLAENNDREDLDPIERAIGIRTMVEELGGKAKVAEHYEKSAGWVTQQMYLLDLVPDLQELVSSGELPLRETRTLVKLPASEQMDAWRVRTAEREEEKAQPRPPRKPRTQPTAAKPPNTPVEQSFTAVKAATSEGAAASAAAVEPARNAAQADGTPAGTPMTEGFTAVKPASAPLPSPTQGDTYPAQPKPTTGSPAADPLADFAVYVNQAVAFTDSLWGMTQAYTRAAKADPQGAAELADRFRAHLAYAAEQLPIHRVVQEATA
ncbi:ParB/RepB/Spo0J family partition protein [Kitasatospora sp. NPDC092948]|uniref:ParB/RepB/Spo0J family partition protein n=1 Tax=Kitasatospora sp. NPDC092948 TaxID=3364088 RepID=UPI00380987C6